MKGNGNIDFYEMVRNILPDDYPGKTWSVIRGEEIMAEEMKRLYEGKRDAVRRRHVPNFVLSPDTHRSARSSPGRAPTARSRTPSSRRPVSRAVKARLNSIERMRTSRQNTARK